MSDIDVTRTVLQDSGELIAPLKALISAGEIRCTNDIRNPCWNNRKGDIHGQHWGSTPENPIEACAACQILSAVRRAEERTQTSGAGEGPGNQAGGTLSAVVDQLGVMSDAAWVQGRQGRAQGLLDARDLCVEAIWGMRGSLSDKAGEHV